MTITLLQIQALYHIYNRKYTSLSMDNVYGDKRLLMADPINHILEGVPKCLITKEKA
jgi:hypothetical protein